MNGNSIPEMLNSTSGKYSYI